MNRQWPQKSPRVTRVVPLDRARLELTFDDGTNGILDLNGWVVGQGGVFAPLADPAFFRTVRLSRSGGTIEWPGDIDLCPDVLYSRLTGIPIPFAEHDVPAATT
jgi:hypothetical protein